MKDTIVLHHSAINDEKHQSVRVQEEHSKRLKQKGAYHYFIERDGSKIQFHDEEFIAYHAGDYPVNVRSIGICLAGDLTPGKQNPTIEQMDQLFALLCDIIQRRGIERKNIKLHWEVRDSPTSCPGRDLRPQIFARMDNAIKRSKLQKLKQTFSHVSPLIKRIKQVLKILPRAS